MPPPSEGEGCPLQRWDDPSNPEETVEMGEIAPDFSPREQRRIEREYRREQRRERRQQRRAGLASR